ncbi:MAG: phosphoenolpyruvate carboxylase, partial [Pyrinomonadaceae bacterium]
LLGGVLDEDICAVEGPEALELHRQAIELGERSRSGEPGAADQLAQLVAGLDLTQIALLIRMLTRWFQLMNLAEDLSRVRRIRTLDAQPEPRRGSLHAAIEQLAEDGTTAEELDETLREAEVRL